MAIVVLVLWAFTAGAGFYLLISGNLGRPIPAAPAPAPLPIGYVPPRATTPAAPAAASAASVTTATASAASVTTATASAKPLTAPSASASTDPAASSQPRATAAPKKPRDPWAPPSLAASRQAPILPGARALAEFAHPAVGVIGLGFWLGFTLIHARVLGWIGFGLAAATACAGLAWFTANNRAARQLAEAESGTAPSFPARFVALHGSAAGLTIALAALTALLLRP